MPQARDTRKNAWILEATWRLINKRVSAQRYPTKDQLLIQRLGRAIAAILKGNRRRRAEELGAEVEALIGLEPPLHREAWHRIKGWYQATVDRAPSPAWVTLEQITAERVELYSYAPPPGVNTPISVEPLPVDESVPTEEEIERAVKRLQNHRSRGPLGGRAEHLKGWLAAARKKEEAAGGEETTDRTRLGDAT